MATAALVRLFLMLPFNGNALEQIFLQQIQINTDYYVFLDFYGDLGCLKIRINP